MGRVFGNVPVEGKMAWWLLGVLATFTAVAAMGYAAFGVRPERLLILPGWAAAFYGRAFGFFAMGQVWLSFAVAAAVLTVRSGGTWLPAFGVLYGISLSSELAGTTWGLPFGDYEYSALLGPMWLGRVPLVIPASWFFMTVASYALATRIAGGAWKRVATASLILLAWDLALDPAMSHATPYWLWSSSGPYYGMPWLNLFGWYATGLVLATALALLQAERWTSRVSDGWWAAFYGVNLALPLAMCVAAGLWVAVAVTVTVFVLPGLAWLLSARRLELVAS